MTPEQKVAMHNMAMDTYDATWHRFDAYVESLIAQGRREGLEEAAKICASMPRALDSGEIAKEILRSIASPPAAKLRAELDAPIDDPETTPT